MRLEMNGSRSGACGWDGLRWSCDVCDAIVGLCRDSGDAACGGYHPSSSVSIVVFVFLHIHCAYCTSDVMFMVLFLHRVSVVHIAMHLVHRLNLEHGRVR